MTSRPSPPTMPIVVRARELARSGEALSVNHIRQTLIREGYIDVGQELKGPGLNVELVTLIRATRTLFEPSGDMPQ